MLIPGPGFGNPSSQCTWAHHVAMGFEQYPPGLSFSQSNTMPATMTGMTADQLSQFETEGYTMVPDVFDASDLQGIREEITQLIHEGAVKLKAEGKVSSLYEEEPFERRLTRLYADCGSEITAPIVGLGGGGHSGPALFGLVTHPSLLARVESLIGPEIVGSSVYRIRPKIPGQERAVVPWHQDSGYFSPHCDQDLIVTCWIPLVDTRPDNGCLRVLPRSHRQGVSRHHTNGPGGFLVILEEDLPEAEPVTVPVPLGGVLFMTNCTPHRSTPHEVDEVRWAIDVRYQSADTPNNLGELPGDFDLERPDREIACYPPEADFVVQSRLKPDSVVTEWAEFNTLRQQYEGNARPPGPKRGWVPVQ